MHTDITSIFAFTHATIYFKDGFCDYAIQVTWSSLSHKNLVSSLAMSFLDADNYKVIQFLYDIAVLKCDGCEYGPQRTHFLAISLPSVIVSH